MYNKFYYKELATYEKWKKHINLQKGNKKLNESLNNISTINSGNSLNIYIPIDN